jgi:hypothetical protein
MNRRFLNIAFLTLLLSAAKSQSTDGQESYIARAGNRFISEKEFLERYELLPAQYRNRQNNTEESKLYFLYSLIAEKLLAQEALDRRLDQDSVYEEASNDVRSKLARDRLYRNEISAKVRITEDEVRGALADAQRRLFLSYIYCEDSTVAEFIRMQLRRCREFDRFRIDTSMAVLRDTATVSWGEAEASIEKAAFRLKRGQCSPVVKASTGYYILHLDDASSNPYYASMDKRDLLKRVENTLRLRKENLRLDAYLQEVFRVKIGYSLPRPFKALAILLMNAWSDAPSGTEKMITDSLLEALPDRYRSISQDSLVVFGTSFWTVQEALTKLRGKVFIVDPRTTTGIAAQLNGHLRVLVQQELLSEEALAQKLDETPSVKKELSIWRDKILADMAEIDFRRRVRVFDEDVFQYLSGADPDFQYPRVQICELHAKSREDMESDLAEVRSGMPLKEVIRKYSSDPRTAQNDGLSDEFAINTREPLGTIAWKMNIGERMGPLHLKEDYIFFELIRKIMPAGVSESAFDATMHGIAAQAGSLKQKKALDAFIAMSAHERGYDIFIDRLKLLKVSRIPMMTYRILGFGGRMFAAPFVSRQVDWTTVANPEETELP